MQIRQNQRIQGMTSAFACRCPTLSGVVVNMEMQGFWLLANMFFRVGKTVSHGHLTLLCGKRLREKKARLVSAFCTSSFLLVDLGRKVVSSPARGHMRQHLAGR